MNTSKIGLKKSFREIWPVVAILLIAGLFFWKYFIKGLLPLPGDFVTGVYYPWLDYKWGYEVGVPVKNPIVADVVSLIYPEQMVGVDLMKSGQWPLWNPYILAGTPLLANTQAAPFSPTIFLYFILNKLDAWSIQIFLQHFLTILFSYFLLRRWKLSKVGAIFGGVAFSFSGFNLIFSQWNGHTLASAFIPLSIFFIDRWYEKTDYRDAVGLIITLTLQLFSGYPQTSLYTFILLVIYVSMRIIGGNKKDILRKSAKLLPYAFFCLGLSAIQLLPTKELWTLSQRDFEPNSYEWAFLPWVKLITILAPDYFGNHATGNYWGPQDYTSNTAYIGIVVAILSLLSLKLVRKNNKIKFLAAVVVISLALSFPTPLARLIWNSNVIGMKASSAHRATVIFTFAASMLSAYGFDMIYRARKIKFKNPVFLVTLILIGFLVPTFVKILFTQDNSYIFWMGGIAEYKVALRNLLLPIMVLILTGVFLIFYSRNKTRKKLAGLLLFLLMMAELFRFGWKFTPFVDRNLAYPTTPILDFLSGQKKPFRSTTDKVIPMNLPSFFKLETPEGYETIHPLRMSKFIAALNSGTSSAKPMGRYGTVDDDTARLLDLVNTRFYLTYKMDAKGLVSPSGEIDDRYNSDRFKKAFEDKSVAVLESSSSLPRAFFVNNWEIIKRDEDILDRLLDPSFDYSSSVILEEDIEFKKDHIYPINPEIAAYRSYKEQESEIYVDARTDGMLFVSDAYYPGWKAYVDGNETKIYRANFAFRAVAVPAGEHIIRFIYLPDSFYNGLRISAATLIVLLLIPAVKSLLKYLRAGK